MRCVMTLNRATFLPQVGSADDIRAQYRTLYDALDEFIKKQYSEWLHSIPKVKNLNFLLTKQVCYYKLFN